MNSIMKMDLLLMLMKHYSLRTKLQAIQSLNKCHIDVCIEEYTSKKY